MRARFESATPEQQTSQKRVVAQALRSLLSALTIFGLMLTASTLSSVGFAADSCEALFDISSVSSSVAPKVAQAPISEETFRETTLNLRSTLSGKLATVWRSEWKTKLTVFKSNSYVRNMVLKFLSPETRAVVLEGLNPLKEEFVRTVHERMYRLQQEGKMKPEDELLVRDPPAPLGTIDRTFTYYTKPIVSEGSTGKHQIRVRTYLREILLDKIPLSNEVSGYDMNGQKVAIKKSADGRFEVTLKEGDAASTETLSKESLQKKFGTPIYLFAPHGKKFKLEVKTALTDEITTEQFPLLKGDHMVQKLDMSLSMKDVAKLFSPIDPSLDATARAAESNARLKAIAELNSNLDPDAKTRMNAVLEVLSQGVASNADFLKIEGATLYHRTAFESRSGFQTTVDREQGVFAQNMYGGRGLKSPAGVMLHNTRLHTGVEDARHVELKVPVTAVVPMLGMNFHIPPPELTQASPTQQASMLEAIQIYYMFVDSADHSGKFNYMLQNHFLDDH